MKKAKPIPKTKSRGGRPRKPISPTALAAELGVSRQTVWHKLKTGASVAQIREEARVWHETIKARRHPGDNHTDKTVDGMVSGVVDARGNGHAAPPPFTESQAAKEAALAGLRTLELETKRGDLAPVTKLQSWVIEAIAFERGHTFALPTLLREHGHAVAGDLAERLLRHIFHDADDHMRRRAKSYGIALPPPLPPPPTPAQLPAHLQYVRDAIDGSTEAVPFEQRILSHEWRQSHPSIDVQGEFKIVALKRQWDTDMAALLNRRKTWDLPPESDALKERADADTTLEES